MARSGMQPVYVGDIGEIHIRAIPKPLPNIDLDELDIHQLFALAIECGIEIRELIGIDHCYEHNTMVAIGNRELPMGFNWIEHVKYCKNCFLMYRLRKLP